MFITALLTAAQPGNSPEASAAGRASAMRRPHRRCRPLGHSGAGCGAGGGWGSGCKRRAGGKPGGEDLLSAVSLHRQKGLSSEKSHAAEDTSSLARVKGSRCLPAKQETPSLVGHEHNMAMNTKAQASPPWRQDSPETPGK